MPIEIRALTPDMKDEYLDFFDHRAFSDGSPYYPCYCGAFNLSAEEIGELRRRAAGYGGGEEGWKQALRASASRMVEEGKIRGYLAFDGGTAVGWCNANDRTEYFRVGEFDLDRLPPDLPPDGGIKKGQIKAVVCFEICPGYRGRGIARQLLQKVCADARGEGYLCVEGYPAARETNAPAFTGPVRLYEKEGFTQFRREGDLIVMRKILFPLPGNGTPVR